MFGYNYVLLALISIFIFKMILSQAYSKAISGTTRQIANGRYLIVDYQLHPLFNGSRDVAMETNFRVKIGKTGLFIVYS